MHSFPFLSLASIQMNIITQLPQIPSLLCTHNHLNHFFPFLTITSKTSVNENKFLPSLGWIVAVLVGCHVGFFFLFFICCLFICFSKFFFMIKMQLMVLLLNFINRMQRLRNSSKFYFPLLFNERPTLRMNIHSLVYLCKI